MRPGESRRRKMPVEGTEVVKFCKQGSIVSLMHVLAWVLVSPTRIALITCRPVLRSW